MRLLPVAWLLCLWPARCQVQQSATVGANLAHDDGSVRALTEEEAPQTTDLQFRAAVTTSHHATSMSPSAFSTTTDEKGGMFSSSATNMKRQTMVRLVTGNRAGSEKARATPRPTPRLSMATMDKWTRLKGIDSVAPASSFAPMMPSPTRRPVAEYMFLPFLRRDPPQMITPISGNLARKQTKETMDAKSSKGSKSQSFSQLIAQFDTAPPALTPKAVPPPVSLPMIIATPPSMLKPQKAALQDPVERSEQRTGTPTTESLAEIPVFDPFVARTE